MAIAVNWDVKHQTKQKLDRPKYNRTDFCISKYLSGIHFVYWIVTTRFSRSLFYKEKRLDFGRVLRKILYLLSLQESKQD